VDFINYRRLEKKRGIAATQHPARQAKQREEATLFTTIDGGSSAAAVVVSFVVGTTHSVIANVTTD
jgi:hypothetical protein